MQDQDKPFILSDNDSTPFRLVFRNKRYELPGEIPVSMNEAAMAAIAAGATENQLAAGQVVVFLREVCPPKLANEVRKSGSSALNNLFQAWGAHVGLGEGLAS